MAQLNRNTPETAWDTSQAAFTERNDAIITAVQQIERLERERGQDYVLNEFLPYKAPGSSVDFVGKAWCAAKGLTVTVVDPESLRF